MACIFTMLSTCVSFKGTAAFFFSTSTRTILWNLSNISESFSIALIKHLSSFTKWGFYIPN